MQTFHSLPADKAATGGVWVIIPVKSLSEAKSRLATVFTPDQRHHLTINLLRNTLSVLSSPALADVLAGLVVVSSDRLVLDVAEANGAVALNEQKLIGLESRSADGRLNTTLKATAHRVLKELTPRQLIILHADLPLLQPADLQALLKLSKRANVVLAPDRHGSGTNAVLLEASVVQVFEYLFGPNSFDLHCEALSRQKVSFEVCRQAGLAFDLDRVEDFESLSTSLKESLLQ